ncbi:MAG: hypothetical protein SVS15_01515 [Thermodesulfobacteriota bacterium]|nr:hypothetical protein [Thermodesulfobacteriota bacterium]
MDFAALHLDERFRPWHDAGLRFLYQEGHGKFGREPKEEKGREDIPWDRVWERYELVLARRGKTVWTYWDLGYDLGGRPNPDRRKLLKTIMDKLNWPKGSIAFWPMAYLWGDELFPNPDFFWRGVRKAGARGVVCLGRRAFDTLFPDKDFSGRTFTLNNVRVLALPGPAEIAAGSSDSMKRTLDTLRDFNAP